MALSMTKVAVGCKTITELRDWLEQDGNERRMTTRYLPKRHEDMAGGSLYWILAHVLVGRSPLLGFEQRPQDNRWWIRLEPKLILTQPRSLRAHQGWRYLSADDAPPDLPAAAIDDALPPRLASELARLCLI